MKDGERNPKYDTKRSSSYYPNMDIVRCVVTVVLLSVGLTLGGFTLLDGRLNLRPVNSGRQGRAGQALFIAALPGETMGTMSVRAIKGESRDCKMPYMFRLGTDGRSYDGDSVPMMVRMLGSRRSCELVAAEWPDTGRYELHIPEGMLELFPATYEEVDTIDFPEEDLMALKVGGAWHVKGEPWAGKGLFSFHDDDGVDGVVYKSEGGYFKRLYPLLESLGIRGCISMEGRRTGWLSETGEINDNARIAMRLQNERGWEIMSHSMTCLGEIKNNWVVESLDSRMARKILANAERGSIWSASTTTVYCRSDGIQYAATEEGWEESPGELIKPFAADYDTGQVVVYNPSYDAEYQWGSWFEKAADTGFAGKSWVMHNGMSCHANIPEIARFSPYGFVDVWPVVYNEPPLMTAATRMLCEGQMFEGVPAAESTDNRYDRKQFEWLRSKIDEASEKGAWIVMGMHAYRNCWKNYLPGSLVSEGGGYPDEWVHPMEGVDPLNDALTPPERLGIKDWSEWYPCPGTRLRMMWDLLKHALDKGMVNVTSSEGFERIGNRRSAGYFSKGIKFGYDFYGMEGTRPLYPHYVVGANGEIFYYSSKMTDEIVMECRIREDETGHRIIEGGVMGRRPANSCSIGGLRISVDIPDQLPKGIWISGGKKIMVK